MTKVFKIYLSENDAGKLTYYIKYTHVNCLTCVKKLQPALKPV